MYNLEDSVKVPRDSVKNKKSQVKGTKKKSYSLKITRETEFN